jgi:hypothetical protein
MTVKFLESPPGNAARPVDFILVLLFREDRFFTTQETLESEIIKCAGDERGSGGYDPIL